MRIYKIFRAPEWAELQTEGRTAGAPVDLADGFIHFSTAAQAPETAAKHFAGAEGLVRVGTSGGQGDLWTGRGYDPAKLWAFKPLQDVKPPRPGHPVDAFIDSDKEAGRLVELLGFVVHA